MQKTNTLADVVKAQLRFIFWQAAFQGLQILFRFGPTVIALVLLKDALFKISKERDFAAARIVLSKCYRPLRYRPLRYRPLRYRPLRYDTS
jgi:hypothetical protein